MFFLYSVLILLFKKSSQMLLNQTDVDEDSEVIITIDSSTETDLGTMSRATITLPEKLQKPHVKQRRVYSLEDYTLF